MSKKKNLRHVLRSAVMNSFRENMDKKDLKRKGEAEGKVFSHGSKYALLDRINDFCKTLPAGMKLEDIEECHILNYLDYKAKTCTQKTVDEYRSDLKRIGLCAGVDLSCGRVYANKKESEHRGAQAVISKEDFAQILEYCKEHPSGSATAILLEAEIGVRVSDAVYGIHLAPSELHIRAKNGKWMTRPITPEIRRIIDSEAFKTRLVGDKWYGDRKSVV